VLGEVFIIYSYYYIYCFFNLFLYCFSFYEKHKASLEIPFQITYAFNPKVKRAYPLAHPPPPECTPCRPFFILSLPFTCARATNCDPQAAHPRIAPRSRSATSPSLLRSVSPRFFIHTKLARGTASWFLKLIRDRSNSFLSPFCVGSNGCVRLRQGSPAELCAHPAYSAPPLRFPRRPITWRTSCYRRGHSPVGLVPSFARRRHFTSSSGRWPTRVLANPHLAPLSLWPSAGQ